MVHDEDGYGMPTEPDDRDFSIFDRLNNYLLLVYSLSCFMMYFALTMMIYLKGHTALSLIVPAVAGVILPLYILSRRFGLDFFREYRLAAPSPVTSLIVLAIAAGSILPSDAITWLLERNNPASDDYIRFLLAIKPKGLLSFLLLASGIVVLSPLAEEMLFRGFVQRIFGRNMRGPLAVFLAALVFGSSHFNLEYLPGVTLLGLVLGYLFYRTSNLAYPFMAHALFNLVSLVKLHRMSEEAVRLASRGTPSPKYIALSLAALAGGILVMERAARGERKKDGRL